MTTATRAVALGVSIGLFSCIQERPARTDVVLQWNQQVVATGGPQLQRTLAMVHIAMFDVVNAIEPRYTPYLPLPAPPPRASLEAAAAGAAYGLLIRLFPSQQQTLTAALVRSLAAVPDGAIETESVRYGDLAAETIYAARLSDNILEPGPRFIADSAPGAYQPTDMEPAQPINSNAGHWTPFALMSSSQFRPDHPPALISSRYARDLEEVQRLGGGRSVHRTREHDTIARWHTELGHVQFNRLARTEAAVDGRDLLDHARMFALLNLALADATTSVFAAKYAYQVWRPLTAIRQADRDANPNTHADRAWSPFLPTPPHPEYPSAHSALQSAGARVLTEYFGRRHSFQATSSVAPGVTRHYASFEAFADEGRDARVFGGMHFRTAVDAGAKQGARVADWVLAHHLLPR